MRCRGGIDMSEEKRGMGAKEIAKLYGCGIWSRNMVRMAVRKGYLTMEAYEKIVGEKY